VPLFFAHREKASRGHVAYKSCLFRLESIVRSYRDSRDIQGYFVGILAARFMRVLRCTPFAKFSSTLIHSVHRKRTVYSVDNFYEKVDNRKELSRYHCTLNKMLPHVHTSFPRLFWIIRHVFSNFFHKAAVQLNRDGQLCEFREVFEKADACWNPATGIIKSTYVRPGRRRDAAGTQMGKNDGRTWLIMAVRFLI